MESIRNDTLEFKIVAVVSNHSDALALILEKGRSLGVTVTTMFVSSKGLSREQHDAEWMSIFAELLLTPPASARAAPSALFL